ncbi:restriction endonuclease subunit S [Fibrobacter sp.]|uniref:restriction endonuclease subunit S n=1 Tax=Fibrobacter sp. TaxID=35828 RepID=UPI0025C70E0D|nr:restriction endonuclease subunit S [Fibrobacter sp.]MBR3073459.1 restriction endonuclease subunit S [Fibrobacter sp.]
MDGKQLKNSILQWAIQGKLVPQNPKDEPAQKLLERIAASRNESSLSLPKGTSSTSLRGAKATKQSKNQPSRIYRENGVWYEQLGNAEPKDISEDVPFEIPENWAWCRLNHLTELIEDCPHSTASNEGSGYPLIRTPNIGFGRLDLRGVHRVSEDVYNKRNARAIPQSGDLIFAREAPAGNIAVIQEGEIVCLGQRTVLIRPKKDLLNADYLAFYILSPISQQMLVGKSTGTTVAHVNLADFRPYFIALPPLAEQKRIIAKLEQVLPLAEEYGTTQEQLDKLNKELPEALKKSILQEAIQGKLVPQNPKDEPAQKLLERIAASRNGNVSPWSGAIGSSKNSKKSLSTSLRGAKATKQSKNPPSRIYRENGVWYEQIGTATPKDISDEIPFEIPETWAWTRMGNIGSWGAGATPAKGNPAFYKDGEIPWLVTGELNNSVVTETKIKVSKLALQKCSLRLCQPGDVLIAMYGATIGKLAIAGIELTTNQACCACSLYYDYNKYLFYFLMASKSDLIKRGEGGAQPNISKEKLVNYLMPLPPLAEQKRIVAKLEQLFKVL